MSDSFTVGTATARKGSTAWGELPIPDEVAGKILFPVVAVAHGPSSGPTLYVGAGAHGDEFNSIEAVRRAALSLDPKKLTGTVIFIPVQNVAAFKERVRRTPTDNQDIDFCYPGDPKGSPTEQLAHVLFEQAVTRASYVLDLHTAARGGNNLLHALTAPDTADASRKALDLARTFGCSVVVALEVAEGRHLGESMGWNLDNNLFTQASRRGIPATIIEFGEAGRLEPDQVELGIQGIFNVLRELGMVDGSPTGQRLPNPVLTLSREAMAVRPKTQGLLHTAVQIGDLVTKGQLLGRVISFPDEVEEVRSPFDGVVVRVATDGVITPGDRLAVVAGD